MKSFLSADMARNMPKFELKSQVLRTHRETLVHPVFRWIKEEVEVVDHVQFLEIVVTQGGRSWSIPLSHDVQEVPEETETPAA